MLLDSTKKIQVLLAGAPATTQPVLSASWLNIDADGNGTTGSNESNANGTTAVDLIPAPTYARQVKTIFIYNADTATVTVTVRRNVSATTYNICKVALASGYLLAYSYESGWRVLDTNGGLVQSAAAIAWADITGIPAAVTSLSGVNTGDQTSVTGNAGTATALQTARNIDGQAFDGTANITVIAPGTHAATSKATPVDADELPLVDSAASNVLKKLTWANLKATLKTYLDTLYAPIAFTPNMQLVTSASTVTPTFSNDMVRITAQAASLTLANPTGTAVDGWGIAFEIIDNGTARSITWGSQYRGIGGTLPSTTVLSKRMMFAAIYNAADTKWDVPLPVAQEA